MGFERVRWEVEVSPLPAFITMFVNTFDTKKKFIASTARERYASRSRNQKVHRHTTEYGFPKTIKATHQLHKSYSDVQI